MTNQEPTLIEVFQTRQNRNPSIASRRKKVQEKDHGPPKLVRSEEFMSIARTVLEANIRKDFADYGLLNSDGTPRSRTWMKDCNWPIGNLTLTGKYAGVTKEVWANMVGCALDGMKKTINNSQGNGEWQPFRYDIDVLTTPDQVQRIFLVVQWIDMNNEQDLKYHNGREASTIEVKNDISADLLKALQGGGNNNAQMDMLIKLMIQREQAELKKLGVEDEAPYNEPPEDEDEVEVAQTESEIAPKVDEPLEQEDLLAEVKASTTGMKRRRKTRS